MHKHKMVRTYIKTTDCGQVPEDVFKLVADEVISQEYLKLKKRNFVESKEKLKKKSKPKTNNIVSSDEEEDYFCIVCLGAYSKSR
ncbi:hypothetical protein QTP88_017648 [Uroleucon formosanum]